MSPEDYKDEIERAYVAYEDYLNSTRLEFFKQLTGAILTLSSGALALSLVMIKTFGDQGEISYPQVLVVALSAFALSVVGTLSAFIISILSLNKQSEYAKKYYLEGDDGYFRRENPWTYPRVVCIYGSAILFIVGIISLIAVASLNI
ncbi:hypothetical protein QGM61_07680 [Pseudohongiella sp. SYSU M77423]|uniref:hypothetical protein n=1 Tax=Pseudohongiella sp. SYSU M77423 TaxID=3042312 RepID=UPI00247FE7E1|nr:hypothetical protein [Pseudohongiella sp. SYSU M77423]MDH7943698.1 hypothetical protein [Pseudohongiella sp. SYSU M77423]